MKIEKEITVLVKDNYEKLHNDLIKQGFKIITKFKLYDIYIMFKDINIENKSTLDILKKCLIIRNNDNLKKTLLYKYKQYDKNEAIVEEGKIECNIDDIEKAKNLFKAIGFISLFEIQNQSYVYCNNFLEIVVQLVNNKYIFIEMEDQNRTTKKYYTSIDEMVEDFKTLKINYDKTNYFVKKAEIIYNEKYKNF